MGVITLKLDDALERKLRRKAADVYGLTRGSLSRAVEDALSLWLRSDSARVQGTNSVRYMAFKDGKSIMQADSLRRLAESLKKTGIDVRDVEVRSSIDFSTVEKLGLRVTHRQE